MTMRVARALSSEQAEEAIEEAIRNKSGAQPAAKEMSSGRGRGFGTRFV